MSEHQQTQQSKESKPTFQKQANLTSQNSVSHPASIIQRARINPKSLTAADVLQLQRTIGNRAVGRLLSEIRNTSKVQQAPIQRQKLEQEETCPSCMQRQEIPEEEETLQGKMIELIQKQAIPEEEKKFQMKSVEQRQEIPEEEEPLQKKSESNTGMPDNLKSGVESLSGIDMSAVRVHYNSSKPAHVGALAYTQGTNIHIAPGQEKHLPHEAWHVVQQKQGRVKPTMQAKDVAINDEAALEHEANVMGASSLKASSSLSVKIARKRDNQSTVAQLTTENEGFELLKNDGATSPEITFMLAIEPDAQTIHSQIIAEAHGNATNIHQLYVDGATSPEITALLAIEPDAQTIHNYMQTVVPGFTINSIQFASVAGGRVGSIYFTNGRIRLTHNHNPEVSVHAGITRYTINAHDYGQYKQWLAGGRIGGGTSENYIRNLPSFAPAVVGGGGRLIEFWPGHKHISRGGPMAFNYNLTQVQLNIICNVANLRNNAKLRAWMRAIPGLAVIPIN